MTVGTARHYLDHACTSPPSSAVVEAVRAAATTYAAPSDGGGTELALRWLDLRDEARAAVASLLRVPAESVTLVENTTQGLGALVDGLDLRPGDNVAIPDCEFLGLTTVWRRREAAGVELRPIPSRQGAVRADDVVGVIDGRTRVVALSSVQEVSGLPVDVDAVVDAATAVGALVVVDGVQEVGVLDTDLGSSGVAAYVAGGHKWLRNPYGLGFLWTSEELRQQLRPPHQGYFALTEPAGGWGSYLADPRRDAFDAHGVRGDGVAYETGGTPNWLGAVGLTASVTETLRTGMPDVERRARARADAMRAGLLELGVEDVLTPVGARSAIVTFRPPGDDLATDELLESLREARVDVSIRGVSGVRGIRAACHAHNRPDDVDALLDVTARTLDRRQNNAIP